MNNRQQGLVKMGEGVSSLIKELHAKDEVGGALAVGGSQATGVSLLILKNPPLGEGSTVPRSIQGSALYVAQRYTHDRHS